MRAHAPVRNPLASFVSVTPGYPRPCRKAVRVPAAGVSPPFRNTGRGSGTLAPAPRPDPTC